MSCSPGAAIQACEANGGIAVCAARPSIPENDLELLKLVAGMTYQKPERTFIGAKFLKIPGGSEVLFAPKKTTMGDGYEAWIADSIGMGGGEGFRGYGATEREAFDDLQGQVTRYLKHISSRPDLADVVSAARSATVSLQSRDGINFHGDGVQVANELLNLWYTDLRQSDKTRLIHGLVNTHTGDAVYLETDGPLHNYVRVALAMRERGGALNTCEDIEWALLHNKNVPFDILMQSPDLLAKYGAG